MPNGFACFGNSSHAISMLTALKNTPFIETFRPKVELPRSCQGVAKRIFAFWQFIPCLSHAFNNRKCSIHRGFSAAGEAVKELPNVFSSFGNSYAEKVLKTTFNAGFSFMRFLLTIIILVEKFIFLILVEIQNLRIRRVIYKQKQFSIFR